MINSVISQKRQILHLQHQQLLPRHPIDHPEYFRICINNTRKSSSLNTTSPTTCRIAGFTSKSSKMSTVSHNPAFLLTSSSKHGSMQPAITSLMPHLAFGTTNGDPSCSPSLSTTLV
eukprot:CCRYP_017601-RA/>CCRYP_017601-RA protein AED:0.43 eAED:0.47 QI:0/-1/0/1/-1/0/1/0/116